MTNGIAVGLRDHTRDYWHNGRCCSGYSYAKDGDVLGHMFRNYLRINPYGMNVVLKNTLPTKS